MGTNHDELFHRIAGLVCDKPPGLSATDCHGDPSRNTSLCREHACCRIDEKSQEQLAYVTSPTDRPVFLRACPGSGKTETVGLKAAYEIRQWPYPHRGLAVLTFTNAAADVIRDRAMQFVGADRMSHPHYIGTIDSWLHGYLANPFGHIVTGYEGRNDDEGWNGDGALKVIDERNDAGWLARFTARAEDQPGHRSVPLRIRANAVHHALHGDAFDLLPFPGARHWRADEAHFDSPALEQLRLDNPWLTIECLRTALGVAKQRFWHAGFVTHRDVEYICQKLLIDRPDIATRLARRFPIIVVDECQDLSPSQLVILAALLKKGANVHFVGDLGQAIWSFRRVEPKEIEDFAREHGFQELPLSHNFRSLQPIVDLCGRLCPDQGRVQGRATLGSTQPSCLCFAYTGGQETELVSRFVDYLHERGLQLDRSAVLARGSAAVAKLRPGIARKMGPAELAALAMHLWVASGAESRGEALECMGRLVADQFFRKDPPDSREYYVPRDKFRPVPWRIALARILNDCQQEQELKDINRTWTDWTKALNARLPAIVQRHCPGAPSAARRVQSPSNKKDDPVIDGLGPGAVSSDPEIRVTTIHKAKGETLDAVLLVSAVARGKGGHWKEWLPEGDDGEHARFAYVASSRPRYLLAWAVPSPSTQDRRELEDLGFRFLPGDEEAPPSQGKLEFGP